MSFSAAATGTQKTLALTHCQIFQGHRDWVRGVIHLPCGQRIMTCSSDGSLRVWDLKTGEQIGDAWRNGKDGVVAIALSLEGKKVVCGCVDGAVELWDIDTGKIIAKWTGHTSCVASVSWHRDCGRVVSASRDGTARVWDVGSGKAVLAIETGLSQVQAVIYSPDTTMIATGGVSKDLKALLNIWDSKTGKLITNLKGHTHRVSCLAWTADGSTLISGSWDESIRTWNTTTWQQIHVLTGHTEPVLDVAISPNINVPILASVSLDSTARLWNLENGLPINSPLQHPRSLPCVSFSTDGKLLVTGCWNSGAYSWDISGILEEAGLLNPNDGDKSLIDADATRRPGHRHKDVHRVPPRFFDDAPHLHPSRTLHLSSSSARQYNVARDPSSHRRAYLGPLSSLFQRNNYNTQNAPPRLHFLEWARRLFVHLPLVTRNDEGVELQERCLTVVNVPFTRGKPRNYSVGELRRKEEKEKQKAMQAKNANNAQDKKHGTTNASATNSSLPNSGVIQQSSAAAHAQPTSQLHVAVSPLSTTPAVASISAATTTTSRPDAMIPRTGRWTRPRPYICCVSAQYSDD